MKSVKQTTQWVVCNPERETLLSPSRRGKCIDEYTREALMIRVDRTLNTTDVLDAPTDLFILRGPPEYIRSDNAPEFIA